MRVTLWGPWINEMVACTTGGLPTGFPLVRGTAVTALSKAP